MFIRIGQKIFNTDRIIKVEIITEDRLKGSWLNDSQTEQLKGVPCVTITTEEYCEADSFGDNQRYFFYGDTAQRLINHFWDEAQEIAHLELPLESFCKTTEYKSAVASDVNF
jgi:hypothetical protein